jgi:hypothetical protein
MTFHHAKTLAIAVPLLVLGCLAPGCVTWTTTEERLAPELERLASTPGAVELSDVAVGDRNVLFRVSQSHRRRYRQTTVIVHHTELQVFSLTRSVQGTKESFMVILTIPMDPVLFAISAPISAIGAWISSADPDPEVEELAKTELEPLPEGSKLVLLIAGDPAGALEVRRNGLAGFAFPPGLAATHLKRGRAGVDVTVAPLGDIQNSASMHVSLEQLIRIASAEISGSETQQRDAWRAVFEACPQSSTPVRNALWEKLEPLERRLPYETRVVRLELEVTHATGRSINFRFWQHVESKYRAGTRVRRTRVNPGKGTSAKIRPAIASTASTYSLEAGGRLRLTYKETAAAVFLRNGTRGHELIGTLPGLPDLEARAHYPVAQLIAAADRQIKGTTAQRLAQWRDIYEACPPASVRVRDAILAHFRPLQAAAEREAVNAKALARVSLALEGRTLFPSDSSARREEQRLQEKRGTLLLEAGDHRGAVTAFGKAARQASDLGDLDALERLVRTQLAARKGR